MKNFQDENIDIEEFSLFYDKSFNLAVVGLSPNKKRISNHVARELIKKGFNIIPVYPKEDEILGKKVYRTLEEIEEKVDVVIIFLRPELLFDIVKSAVAIGIDKIWLQEGIISREAAEYADKYNVNFVMNRCYFKTYIKYEKNNS